MSYPDFKAAGITSEGVFTPFELFAGDAETVTDNGICAADVQQFQVIARDGDGKIVPYNELTGCASKTGTFSGAGSDGDQLIFNSQVFTLRTAPSATYDVLIGGTATETAANVAAAVSAHMQTTKMRAVSTGANLVVYAEIPGVGGNSLIVSEGGSSFSWAGTTNQTNANLSGGFDDYRNSACGVTAYASTTGKSVAFYAEGTFNSAALVWPAELDTLAKRQLAFSRSPIVIRELRGVSTPMTFPA